MYFIDWKDEDRQTARESIWALIHMKTKDKERVYGLFDLVAESPSENSAYAMLQYVRGKAVAYYEMTQDEHWWTITLALNKAIISKD